MNRRYRFFILRKGIYGRPFTMCDDCAAAYRVPKDLVMEEIESYSALECNGHRAKPGGDQ